MTKLKINVDIERIKKDIEESEDLSGVRIISQPVEGKLGIDDKLYQIVMLPVAEEVKIKGRTMSKKFVEGLEGIKYCAKKEIIIDMLSKEGDNAVRINGNIVKKVSGESESISLQGAFFTEESYVDSICALVTEVTLERVKYLKEHLNKTEEFLTKQFEGEIY